MKAYRLVISRHGRLLGQFDSDTPWADDAIRDLLQRLPVRDGYRTELFVAYEERRLLESGPHWVKILGREPAFLPLSITALFPGEGVTEPSP